MSSDPPPPPSPSKRTRLDRRLTILLPKNRWDDTASRRDGIAASVERLHRLHGTSLIFEAAADLGLCPSTTATACSLFHRFYHHPTSSLTRFDVWSVAMASLLLSTKIDEGETKAGHVATMRDIIDSFARIYARRVVLADIDDDDDDEQCVKSIRQSSHLACLDEPMKTWTRAEQRRMVCNDHLPKKMYSSGTVYDIWHRQITETESIILNHLGFTVYWIPESHAHKFLIGFCQVLQIPPSFSPSNSRNVEIANTSDKRGENENNHDSDMFLQTAWNYCNDSCRLDLSVRYPAEVIASSAILLASIDLDIQLPTQPVPWWEVFLGRSSTRDESLLHDVVDIANSILGMSRGSSNTSNDGSTTHDDSMECIIATKGFVPSLSSLSKTTSESDGGISFLDPNSFLWDHQSAMFTAQKEKTENQDN